MKPTSSRTLYDAAGGSILPDRSDVDFVLFMPGDHFEIVDEVEFADADAADALGDEDTAIAWVEIPDPETSPRLSPTGAYRAHQAYEAAAAYESQHTWAILDDEDDEDEDEDDYGDHEIEFVEIETAPDAALDNEVTHVHRPAERSWWESAKRGVRALARQR